MVDRDRRRPDSDAAERFDRYLEALLGSGRPSPDVIDDRDEAEMARTAAEMAAAASGDPEATPDPAFVEQLRRRMRSADEAITTIRTPPPVREIERAEPGGVQRWRMSRRELLQAGVGMAAGLAAGVTGAALLRSVPPGTAPPGRDVPLVAGSGFWTDVAALAELSPGTALRFSTVAFDGFVVNDGGTIRALSARCTHMGCTLRFRPEHEDLRCPCHGASFDFAGRLANGTAAWNDGGAYGGDAAAYPIDLPDLPRPRVKVDDGRVWVWTAQT